MTLKFDDAVVLTRDRHFEEPGKIHIEPDYFVYRCDYIPLFAVDQTVTLRCRRKGVEVIELVGKVFVSSRHYLKAQTISLTLLEEGIPYFEVFMKARSQIYRKSNKTGDDEFCTVCAVSHQAVTFTDIMLDEYGKDKVISLSLVKPIYDFSQLLKLEAMESGSMRFGSMPKYKYRILNLSEYAAQIMSMYVVREAEEFLKNFPKPPKKAVSASEAKNYLI